MAKSSAFGRPPLVNVSMLVHLVAHQLTDLSAELATVGGRHPLDCTADRAAHKRNGAAFAHREGRESA